MSYKIFLSYSEQERELAEYVRNVLNDTFTNKIEILFNSIRPGEKWKDVIQKGLKESDAILTILTPRYLQRPWAYIEWSAFWLTDKTTYILLTDDVEIKDIIDPMRDAQSTKIFSEDDVLKLLKIIAEKSESGYIDYKIISEFSNKSKAIYNKLKRDEEHKKYSIYKNATELLPNDDFKKVEILWYFYEQESDRNAVAEVFRSINDNSIKGNILNKLLEKNDLELIEEVYESVEARGNLLPLLKGLIENGYENSELVEKLLSYIASNQSTLRSIAEYLIKNRKVDNKALLNSIPLFVNMAELRKLGEVLIDNAYVTDKLFDTVVQCFYGFNHAELHKLLKYAINDEKYNRPEMTEQIVKLAKYNQREAAKVIYELMKKDIDAVLHIVYTLKVFSNREVLDTIETMLNEFRK